MLGGTSEPSPGDWDRVLVPPEPGRRLGEIRPLFPRKDPTAERPASGKARTPGTAPGPGQEPTLDVRAARIREVAVHPSADRLYVLTVDAGEANPRTVVAGLRAFYTVDELRGRPVALLANLEPRRIRSVESQGMILASESEGRVGLLKPPESAPPGTPILGATPGAGPIPYDAFAQVDLRVGRVTEAAGEGHVRVNIGDRSIEAKGSYENGTTVVVRVPAGPSGEGTVLSFGPSLPLSAPPSTLPGSKVR